MQVAGGTVMVPMVQGGMVQGGGMMVPGGGMVQGGGMGAGNEDCGCGTLTNAQAAYTGPNFGTHKADMGVYVGQNQGNAVLTYVGDGTGDYRISQQYSYVGPAGGDWGYKMTWRTDFTWHGLLVSIFGFALTGLLLVVPIMLMFHFDLHPLSHGFWASWNANVFLVIFLIVTLLTGLPLFCGVCGGEMSFWSTQAPWWYHLSHGVAACFLLAIWINLNGTFYAFLWFSFTLALFIAMIYLQITYLKQRNGARTAAIITIVFLVIFFKLFFLSEAVVDCATWVPVFIVDFFKYFTNDCGNHAILPRAAPTPAPLDQCAQYKLEPPSVKPPYMKNGVGAGCYEITDQATCQAHKDGRSDAPWGGQECVAASPGNKDPRFPQTQGTGGFVGDQAKFYHTCEPKCLILGCCGTHLGGDQSAKILPR